MSDLLQLLLGFIPGIIAQAFVTSAKLTQTQVRAIMNQGITSADVATYSSYIRVRNAYL